ncbi:MAG: BACON domain-containing protein [Bryobacteraceae bacterium]
MDDAKTHLNRIAFIFLTLALAIAAPWSAQAQTFSPTTYGPVQLAVPGGSQVTITGTQDSTAPITFTVSSITYSNGSLSNSIDWLSVGTSGCTGNSSTYQTPATITLTAGCLSGQLTLPGTYTATVNLTSTSPSGQSATITVNITVGSGSGGAGTITPSTSNVTLSAVVGGTNQQTVTLSTSSVSPITYSTAAQPASWLTVSPINGTVSASSPSTLYFYGNATGITSPTTVSTTIYVYYNGTSSSAPITVTFIVGGGGSGTLTLSQPTVSWSYVTSGSLPSYATVYIYGSSATYYGLTFSGSPLFLTANGYSSNTPSTAFTIGNPITVSPNGTVIAGLSIGTYYNYITATDTNGRSATLTVVLTVNSGSSGVITVSPNPISLNGTYLGTAVYATVSVVSTLSGTVYMSIGTSGLSLSTTTAPITAGSPVYLTVYGTPGSLPASTYTGSFNVTVAPTSGTSSQLSVPATFTITGSGGTGTSSVAVAPSTFQFNYEMGTTASLSQSLSINGTVGGSDTYSISSPSQTWLTIGSSLGAAPAVVPIYISNPGSLPVGTSSAYFTVTTTIGGYTSVTQVTVNVLVTSSGVPVLVVQANNGGSINLSYTGGSANPSGQGLYLSASDYSAQAFTATPSASWITLSTSTGTTPASLAVSLNASSLPNGVNAGYITITGSFGTTTVPVVVYVSGSSTSSSGVLTLSQSSLTFNAVSGSTVPSPQTLTVSASSTISFTASATGTNGSITWLSIAPSGSLATTQTLTVSVNQTGLSIGVYSGYITLVTSSGTQTVPVTLNVTNGSNTLTVSPASLSFGYTTGGATPSSQQVSVTAAGSTAVTFTLAYSMTGAGNWLVLTNTAGNAIATGTNEVTGFAFLVYTNPTGLAAGTYTGSISLTPVGGSTTSIPVTLTVTGGSTVSASPSTLSFSYQVGGATPAAQSISVAGAGNAALAFTATASSTGNWLTVTPTSGNSPASLAVTVAPSSLAAGSYTGAIVVAGSGSAGGSTTVTVTLTITAPLPTVTAVVNAGSFASGKIAPGEIVTIGGTALGPVNGLGLTLNSAGKVSTTLGNVSVSFSGYAAPLIYVSSTQINCVVPYEVAALVSPFVQVTYAGQTSNVYSLSASATAPGIFTQNGQGSGPGAVINASGTVNGPSNPAAKGGIVSIYMTGEGQTSPAGVTGSVTAVTTRNGAPFTPQPLFIPAVTIGGQPATIQFYGEAPGAVAGVMQVNVYIPTAAASGTDALVVSIGGNSSQSGVTVSVQ